MMIELRTAETIVLCDNIGEIADQLWPGEMPENFPDKPYPNMSENQLVRWFLSRFSKLDVATQRHVITQYQHEVDEFPRCDRCKTEPSNMRGPKLNRDKSPYLCDACTRYVFDTRQWPHVLKGHLPL